MKKLMFFFTFLFSFSLFAGLPTLDIVETSTNGTGDKTKTIYEIVKSNPDQFGTLIHVIEMGNSYDPTVKKMLSNPATQLTLFAPTNEAFRNIAAAIKNDLFIENPQKLVTLLQYHLLDRKVTYNDLQNLAENLKAILTLHDYNPIQLKKNGELKLISVRGAETIPHITQATITKPDISAKNGIIHIIDNVLMPPQKAQMSHPYPGLPE